MSRTIISDTMGRTMGNRDGPEFKKIKQMFLIDKFFKNEAHKLV